MDLVDEEDLPSLVLSELILGIHEDQASLPCHLLPTAEEGIRIGLYLSVVLLADESCTDDLLAGDILIMPLILLGRRGNDGLGEGFVLPHSLG